MTSLSYKQDSSQQGRWKMHRAKLCMLKPALTILLISQAKPVLFPVALGAWLPRELYSPETQFAFQLWK